MPHAPKEPRSQSPTSGLNAAILAAASWTKRAETYTEGHPEPIALSRRAVLGTGLAVGAMAWLTGCASSTRGAVIDSSELPGPVWPSDGNATIAGNQTPMPQPAPVNPYPQQPIQTPPPQDNMPQVPSGVIARSNWTNTQPKWRASRPMNGVQRITVHHDAINASGLWRQGDVAKRLNQIRNSHLQRGSEWIDIGYHYIVDPAGRVWQGRPISIEGAHVRATNEHNLGICCMGNFEEHRPTSEQLAAVDQFAASQMRRYGVPISRVYTHRELKPTECPGENMQRYMISTRSRVGRMSRA